MSKKGFQFKTVDVEFWSSPESSSRSTAGSTWQQASASFQQQQKSEEEEELEPWNRPYVESDHGEYSVKNARGSETQTNPQNHIEKTFYTLVTHNRKRLEDHEVYLPTSTQAPSDRSTPIPARNETIQMVKTSRNGKSGPAAKIANHTIRSTDTVPIVRIPTHYVEKRETSNVVHGSIASRLNNISGRSVVRDVATGQKMPSQHQPPQGKVTYKYKVDASERRIDYKYHSETMLYNYEQMTKREQLETWTSLNRKPVTTKKMKVDVEVDLAESLDRPTDVSDV